MKKIPLQYHLKDHHQFRIIPSVYPPINFFEDLVDPSEMEMLWEIESLTNERVQQEAGDIFLVSPEDRVSGHGSSVVMAAFTHIGKPSRFTDGSFGIYYASFSKETAIYETVYHRELFFSATNEDPCEIPMRVYEGRVVKPLHDIQKDEYSHLHDPSNYLASQQFGKALRATKSWGVVYNSVRHAGGLCIAAFRPPAVSVPKQVSHLRYVWNGDRISEVLDTRSLLQLA
ncbi:MAG: RES family NAD+ phosphorylase [Gammaproteobacteria bacterium]|nr:RES family NAD+ phosphorylase [Gammaproteobacteria bacterium]